MSKHITLTPTRTYATEQNAVKAALKVYPDSIPANEGLRFITMQTPEGRWFPVFVGQKAVERMVHFHFNVLM